MVTQGAPERVVRRCKVYQNGTAQLPIDTAFEAAFKEAYETMAGKGQRVIACAMLKLPSAQYSEGYKFTADAFPDDGLVFLGLVGLQDPPKPGIPSYKSCMHLSVLVFLYVYRIVASIMTANCNRRKAALAT
jgi:sodium/potassium-transporting ATPase subunit alpha